MTFTIQSEGSALAEQDGTRLTNVGSYPFSITGITDGETEYVAEVSPVLGTGDYAIAHGNRLEVISGGIGNFFELREAE